MSAEQWQARVEIPGTPVRGSGFLVAERHVLTCAHVVRGHKDVRVTLMDGAGARPASVVDAGPWWTPGAHEAGDVAVLELEEPAGVEPARFAPFTAVEIYRDQKLTAFGFPAGHAENGVSSRFTADPASRIGTNLQVTAADDLGVWLRGGFSGAAAVHGTTNKVVGMVKAATRGDARVGVMVPTGELVRHCPALDDLIPLHPFDARAYQRLRAVLAEIDADETQIGRLLTAVRRRHPALPAHLGSLLSIAEALVIETVTKDDDEVRDNLAGLLVRLGTAPTWQWAGENLWPDQPPPPSPADETPARGAIVVRLAPTAGDEAHELTVWTVTGPDGELAEPVHTEAGLTYREWQDRVEEAVERALRRVPYDIETVVVEFVLPRAYLSEAVDEWISRGDDDTQFGAARPVVVRDLDWFSAENPGELIKRVKALRRHGGSLRELLRWRDCARLPGPAQAFKAWLRAGEVPLVLGLAGDWTQPEPLGSAVAAGLPVMLWRRGGCEPEEHPHGERCPGARFRRELTDRLDGVTFDTVAERVRELRAEFLSQETDQQCGGAITLLLDDSRRRPVPLSFAE